MALRAIRATRPRGWGSAAACSAPFSPSSSSPTATARRTMASYTAPLNEMKFALHDVHGFAEHYATLEHSTE